MTKFTHDEEQAFKLAFEFAQNAGYHAGFNHNPEPMAVYEADICGQQIGQEYHVPNGCCGFAWINIKPVNKRFAKWLKETGRASSDSYYGGITIWICEHGQSYERKMKHARVMASELQSRFPELKIYADGRLD